MKRDVPIEQADRLIGSGPVCLLTCFHKGRLNLMTAGWLAPVGYRPTLLGVAIFQGNFTHDLLRQSGEFALNIPSLELVRQVRYCAAVSGRDADKLAATGLHEAESRYVRAPLIDECIGHLECVVVERAAPGDHTLFIAEITSAQADDEAFDGRWLLRERDLRPIHHLGQDEYAVLEPIGDEKPREDEEER